ncbi:MAG TPA: hypothetical protein VE173_08390 [Longimicrobiales bacterium]|nr:hypothetical protein [Longimicrobiales bacterium]
MKQTSAVATLSCTLLVLAAACGTADEDDVQETGSAAPQAAAMASTVSDEETAEVSRLAARAEMYRDVNVALAEGYVPDPSGMCIDAAAEGQDPSLGAMGIHYFRPDLLGITGMEPRVSGTGTHTDFDNPSILIYEPQADGSLVLVATENLVWAAAWEAAGHTAPPSFLGHDYVHMVDDPATEADEAHGFEPHYELHAWVVRHNPSGTFTPFNPAVTCEHQTMPAGQMGG